VVSAEGLPLLEEFGAKLFQLLRVRCLQPEGGLCKDGEGMDTRSIGLTGAAGVSR
jgi:hypothetical protein